MPRSPHIRWTEFAEQAQSILPATQQILFVRLSPAASLIAAGLGR